MYKIKQSVTLIEVLVATVIISSVLVSLMTVTVFSQAILARGLRRLQAVSESDGILEHAVFDMDYASVVTDAEIVSGDPLFPDDSAFYDNSTGVVSFDASRSITVTVETVPDTAAGVPYLLWSSLSPTMPSINAGFNYKDIEVDFTWTEPYLKESETRTLIASKIEE
ncbi:MAG: hypothetical protein PHP69_01910 [Candidatus Omnitrophica bacterium]|nr:hypothetical protein [Candidatus Omnitrophota bacterium]MDD5080797.1 hypothetical protein [Candidatus Omnitrophota bacterium]MDD5440914.1 hypothetical protein [Candidatus Omnitrophota bacterium]